jgi:signal transduction histidine kinase
MGRTRPDKLADEDRERLHELHARLGADLRVMGAQLAERSQGDEARIIEWLDEALLGLEDRREIKSAPYAVLLGIGVTREAFDERVAALYPPVDARHVMMSVNRMLDAELAPLIRHSGGKMDRVVPLKTLSAGLAHEVRNPLNSAKLQLELLERRLKRDSSEPKLLEPVVVTQQELERLTRLLGAFLAFARPAELDLGDYDVVELVRDVAAGEAAAGATVNVDGHEPVLARVDAVKLRQIVQNLVRNAVEASAPAGTVVVRVTGDAATVRIRVEDNGPGIPAEVRNRVFEPFFTTKTGATGLGMSIVYSMVTLHGGTIDLESDDRGTRCEVTLPRG